LSDNVSEILPFNCKVSLEDEIVGHIEGHLRDCDGLTQSRNWFWANSTDVLYKPEFPLDPYYYIVERYMNRTLTFKSDALLAMAGLLAMTEQRTGSKFYYGTCLQDTRGFLWQLSFYEEGLYGSGISPSWAWTSYLGSPGYFLDVKSFDYTWQVAEHHSTRDRGGLEVISWTQWGTLQGYKKKWDGMYYYFIPDKEKEYLNVRKEQIVLDQYKESYPGFIDDGRVLCIFVANNATKDYALLTVRCQGKEDTFVRIGLAHYPRYTIFNVIEAVERGGAVMNSQRDDDNPQRTIQYLV
jgi:hypothetical protein